MCRSWEFQNCKNRPNRSTESEDSFTDNGFTSTAIAAIAAKIAGEKKKFSNFPCEGRPVSEKLSSLPVLRFWRFLQFWNSQNPGIILGHKDLKIR